MPEISGTVEDYHVFEIPPNELPMDGMPLISLWLTEQQILIAQQQRVGKRILYDQTGLLVFSNHGRRFLSGT
jgi:hypothetical protein